MNNKIVSTKTKKTNAVFLAAVLVAGTVALLSPSFIGGAEAYSGQYGNDHNDKFKYKPTFDKSYGKSSAEYKKCININLNFPGLDFSPGFGPQGLGVESLAREGGNNGPNGGHDGFKKFDKDGFVCINANDNSIRGGVDGGGEEATLSVSKTVSCNNPNFQSTCNAIKNQITPDEFTIDVTGNTPNPSQFDGSTTPVDVKLGAGSYQITETAKASVEATINVIDEDPTVIIDFPPTTTFSEDCDNSGQGTIAEGESQICTINNEFIVRSATP